MHAEDAHPPGGIRLRGCREIVTRRYVRLVINGRITVSGKTVRIDVKKSSASGGDYCTAAPRGTETLTETSGGRGWQAACLRTSVSRRTGVMKICSGLFRTSSDRRFGWTAFQRPGRDLFRKPPQAMKGSAIHA